MFCYQCEQTAKGKGFAIISGSAAQGTTPPRPCRICWSKRRRGSRFTPIGRRSLARGMPSVRCRDHRKPLRHGDERRFRCPSGLQNHLTEAAAVRERAKAIYEAACAKAGKSPEKVNGATTWQPAKDIPGLVAQGKEVEITKRLEKLGPDNNRAARVGALRPQRARPPTPTTPGHWARKTPVSTPPSTKGWISSPSRTRRLTNWSGWAMKAGELNLRVMQLLDAANTGTYEHPEPTQVRITPVKGKAICVFRPRPERFGTVAQADRRQGHQHLYARRNAPLPRLPELEEVQAPGGQLRRGLAGSGERVRRLPRRGPDDHQLHPETARQLQEPHLHQRIGRLAGRNAYRPE